jgi:hypothetical protein
VKVGIAVAGQVESVNGADRGVWSMFAAKGCLSIIGVFSGIGIPIGIELMVLVLLDVDLEFIVRLHFGRAVESKPGLRPKPGDS